MMYLFIYIGILLANPSISFATGTQKTINSYETPKTSICYAYELKNITKAVLPEYSIKKSDIAQLGEIFQNALNTPTKDTELSLCQKLETTKQNKKRTFTLYSILKIHNQTKPESTTISKKLSREKAIKCMMALELRNSGHTTSFELFNAGSKLIAHEHEKQCKQIKKLRKLQKKQGTEIEHQEEQMALFKELIHVLKKKIEALEKHHLSPHLDLIH